MSLSGPPRDQRFQLAELPYCGLAIVGERRREKDTLRQTDRLLRQAVAELVI
jgi:hypothetical protein